MSESSSAPVRRRWQPSGPLLGLLALLGVFVLLLALKGELRTFLSLDNLRVLLHKSAIPAICALGMLLIIISGGIDLSVGSVCALVTVVTMQCYRLVYNGPEYVLPALLPDSWLDWLRDRDWLWSGGDSVLWASLAAVPLGVLVGGLCGLVNGLVVTGLRLTPFVATLGMLSVARGLAVYLAGRTRVSFRGPRPGWVDSLASTSSDWLIFDPGVWSVGILAGLAFVLLHFTVLGRHTYAIGSNEATARLCGVAVERNKVLLYTLAGLLAGWAGVLLFAQGNGGDPNAGVGLELEVIAAVVIGGASLSGGQGTVMGTLLGVLILGVLENGVNFFGVPVEVKFILIGGIVIVNTALSVWQRQRRG
jgi:ribose/xylose/arabinose/galactoside ABC-type transport system permease subunit